MNSHIYNCFENWKPRYFVKVLILFIVLNLTLLDVYAEPSNEDQLHNLWGKLLKSYVSDGKVDYLKLKNEEEVLQSYIDKLYLTDMELLSINGQLALYINSYNACTVQLILRNFENGKPVKTIKDIGGFFSSPWKEKFCRVGSEELSLDFIEHKILRPKFKDNRIHFAVNCASKSCPPLVDFAYLPSKINNQLDRVTASFVNDTKFNNLKNGELNVSKIFSWYKEDFPNGVKPFFEKYGDLKLKRELVKLGDGIKINYLRYDWHLNSK